MLLQLLQLLLAVGGGRRRAAAGVDHVQLRNALIVGRLPGVMTAGGGESAKQQARAALRHLQRPAMDKVHTLVTAAEQQQVGCRAFAFRRSLLKPSQLLQKAQKWSQTRSRPCRALAPIKAMHKIVRIKKKVAVVSKDTDLS
jgi:hypothetical protein